MLGIALWCLCRGQRKPRVRIKCKVQATLSCTVHAPGDAYSCAYGLLIYVRGSLVKVLSRGQVTPTTTHTPYLIQEAPRSFALKLWWNRLVWKRKVQRSGCSDPGGDCVCWGAAKRDGIIQFFKVCSLTRRLYCINWWQLLASKIFAFCKLIQVDSDRLGRN